MLSEALKQKIEKYNKLQAEADSLRSEIEYALYDTYGIDDGKAERSVFNDDNICPIHEWGTDIFDLEKIEKLAEAYEQFEKEQGETPDSKELVSQYREMVADSLEEERGG